MKLSKNRIVMILIGGVAVLAFAVLVIMSFVTWSNTSETDDDLLSAESSFKRIAKGKVAPTKKALKQLEANAERLTAWRSNALVEVSVADVAITAVNSAAFKQKMSDDAHRLSKLPGGVEGVLVRPDFDFGFKDYINGAALPSAEILESLQREWADVTMFAELFSECGATELVKVESVGPLASAAQSDSTRKGKASAEKSAYIGEQYRFEVLARPEALVRILNELTAAKRFVVIDALSFVRSADMISDAFSDRKSDSTAKPGRRRSRRGAKEAAAEEESEENRKKTGIVTDPEEEAPFLMRLSVVTYDFGVSKEDGK